MKSYCIIFLILFSGSIPTLREFRVFILQWQGRRRRKNHLGILLRVISHLTRNKKNREGNIFGYIQIQLDVYI